MAEQEEVNLTGDGEKALMALSGGDMRKVKIWLMPQNRCWRQLIVSLLGDVLKQIKTKLRQKTHFIPNNKKKYLWDTLLMFDDPITFYNRWIQEAYQYGSIDFV